MPRFADHLTNIHDVLASSSEAGDVRVNLGNAVTNAGVASDAPWWANGCAFLSRPADPDAGGACEAFYFFNGPQKVCISARDARYYAKAGELQPGDSAIVSMGEARFLLKVANDSITLYTANQQDGEASMLISLIGETGTILTVNGGSYIEQKTDAIRLSAGGSMLVVDSKGVSAFGPHFAANTKSGNLGVVGVVPPPPGLASIICGPAGIIGIPAPFWTVSPS
jgi:hypothetical protein